MMVKDRGSLKSVGKGFSGDNNTTKTTTFVASGRLDVWHHTGRLRDLGAQSTFFPGWPCSSHPRVPFPRGILQVS
jgi:hypothetical protein